MATTTRARPAKQRAFAITFHIEGDDYRVVPLPIDPGVGSRAYRFAKLTGDGAVYDLHLGEFGLECQCKGFLRHGHCKHARTVQAAARVFDLLGHGEPPRPAA